MIITENSILYFYSTYSQSVAAIAGLSATFAIFYYQNLRSSLGEKQEKIYNVFNGPFRGFMTEQERDKFRDFVSHEQRVLFVEPIYRGFLAEGRKSEVGSKLNGNQVQIKEFYAWVDEFNDLRNILGQMIKFRSAFLRVTGFGLLLVVFGLICIGITDVPEIKELRVGICLVAVLLAVWYLSLVLMLLLQAFQKPKEKL
jgi:hypothetical protein